MTARDLHSALSAAVGGGGGGGGGVEVVGGGGGVRRQQGTSAWLRLLWEVEVEVVEVVGGV